MRVTLGVWLLRSLRASVSRPASKDAELPTEAAPAQGGAVGFIQGKHIHAGKPRNPLEGECLVAAGGRVRAAGQ